jgi:hypothetical protein
MGIPYPHGDSFALAAKLVLGKQSKKEKQTGFRACKGT